MLVWLQLYELSTEISVLPLKLKSPSEIMVLCSTYSQVVKINPSPQPSLRVELPSALFPREHYTNTGSFF